MQFAAPTTIGGWFEFLLSALLFITGVVAIVIRIAKMHIDSRINETLQFTIRKAIDDGSLRLSGSIESLKLQLTTQDGELVRIANRIAIIERVVQNGLAHRQERIEQKVDEIVGHLIWDGEERRRQ